MTAGLYKRNQFGSEGRCKNCQVMGSFNTEIDDSIVCTQEIFLNQNELCIRCIRNIPLMKIEAKLSKMICFKKQAKHYQANII